MEFAERRPARIHGYHRGFYIWSKINRGTPEVPGLVLALNSGGSCHGVAYRMHDDKFETELAILWRREMVAGTYMPKWINADIGGAMVRAIAFVVNRSKPGYAGRLDDEQIALRSWFMRNPEVNAGMRAAITAYLSPANQALRLQTQDAIKLIRQEMLGAANREAAQLAVTRFRREAQAASSLRSPHTVELYDFGVTEDQTLYFVMELLEGMTLETLVRQKAAKLAQFASRLMNCREMTSPGLHTA